MCIFMSFVSRNYSHKILCIKVGILSICGSPFTMNALVINEVGFEGDFDVFSGWLSEE